MSDAVKVIPDDESQRENCTSPSEPVTFVEKSESSCSPCVPQPIPPKLPVNKLYGIRAIIGICLLLFSAYLGSIFFMAPLLPLAVLSPVLFRYFNDLLLTSWLMFAEFVICKVFGCRIRHFGDRVIPSTTTEHHSCLFLINHRTQLDWFFVWGLGDPIQRMKIILKDSLAKVPGAGWAMQCGSFIFLRRRIATDQQRLQKIVEYLLKVKQSCQLLIFPEGTNLNSKSLERSDSYGEQNNLPYVRYTLHPRSTGFLHLVKLIGLDNLTEVYDVTVAYPDILPSPEINLIYGHVPHEVHYHVRRFYLNDLLDITHDTPKLDDETNDKLSKWLQNRWLEKENILKEYYANPIGKRSFQNEIAPDSLVFYVDSSDNIMFTYLGLFNTGFWFLSMLLFTCFTYYTNGVNIWATKWISNSVKGENNEINDITFNTTTANNSRNIKRDDVDNNANNVFMHSVQYEGVDQNRKAT
ncbi:putative 1-acylglycerol-3-phosphate acyltransferase [Schistosoma mansoni]|uniref:putative 1-acylglycerol-3-phosphate acyltransferase n=1 Tax=Schistosoma mansoni TaxID=6183 RepID=UPI00022DCA91|nr:putative 1-acylglycerol-3-phosphate acyltransferase [Schistosoma mansoni]|eukprot:XP_018655356.1 putative 1-acylglycerol-3-phosphate acyltransferase [Schistosoma mansoni]